MSSVSVNALQKKLKGHVNEIHAPHTGTIHSISGTILEVYDPEVIESQTLDSKVLLKIQENPGLVYAKVLLDNGTTNLWSFKETNDFFSLIYGNAASLIGLRCQIEFNGLNIYNGRISLSRNVVDKLLNLSVKCKTLDIGSIV